LIEACGVQREGLQVHRTSRLTGEVREAAKTSRPTGEVREAAQKSRLTGEVREATEKSRLTGEVREAAKTSRPTGEVREAAQESCLTGEDREAAKSGPRVKGPMERCGIISILFQVLGGITQWGEKGETAKEALLLATEDDAKRGQPSGEAAGERVEPEARAAEDPKGEAARLAGIIRHS